VKVMKIPGSSATTRLYGRFRLLRFSPPSRQFFIRRPAATKSTSHRKGRGPLHGWRSITSLNDQTDLNVTVYNSNIALVRDVRQLVLPSGTFRLKFMDIAATVNPATVISVR